MNKSRQYMKSVEFKERQAWLDFGCAVSIALRAVGDSIFEFRNWYKEWVSGFRSKKETLKSEQLKLDFLEWMNISIGLSRPVPHGYA